MKKLVGVLTVLLVFGGIAWYLLTDGDLSLGSARKKLVEKAQDVVAATADPEDVAALAMKAINLTQGEQGIELWRLKAAWGNLRRKDNIMELEKPRFTYYMPPDGVAVMIQSDKGDINQEEQELRFVDFVIATYEESRLYAPEMIYLGKKRELVCPRTGRVEGKGFQGSADWIVWQLNTNIMEASGSVDVSFDNEMFARKENQEKTRPGTTGKRR